MSKKRLLSYTTTRKDLSWSLGFHYSHFLCFFFSLENTDFNVQMCNFGKSGVVNYSKKKVVVNLNYNLLYYVSVYLNCNILETGAHVKLHCLNKITPFFFFFLSRFFFFYLILNSIHSPLFCYGIYFQLCTFWHWNILYLLFFCLVLFL